MADPKLHLTTLQTLIDEEAEMTRTAHLRLGPIVPIAWRGLALVQTFIESIARDFDLAAAMLGAIKKTTTLAYLSYVRGHVTQAAFNCRQTIEFASLAAFVTANPYVDAMKENSEGKLVFRSLKEPAFAWMNAELPEISADLKDMKGRINDATAHASLYVTHFTMNFEASEAGEVFEGSFFDNVPAEATQAYLLAYSRMIVLTLGAVISANEKLGGLRLRQGIEDELLEYAAVVDAFRLELMRQADSRRESPPVS